MKLINGRAGKALEHLRAMLDAGQRGYGVAAANVENRALKILFQTYARQGRTYHVDIDR